MEEIKSSVHDEAGASAFCSQSLRCVGLPLGLRLDRRQQYPKYLPE